MEPVEPQPYRAYKGWHCYVNYNPDGHYWLIKNPARQEVESSNRSYALHLHAMTEGLKRMKELADATAGSDSER